MTIELTADEQALILQLLSEVSVKVLHPDCKKLEKLCRTLANKIRPSLPVQQTQALRKRSARRERNPLCQS